MKNREVTFAQKLYTINTYRLTDKQWSEIVETLLSNKYELLLGYPTIIERKYNSNHL